MGRRDYAMLVLLARLGLRAGEVCSLRLDDIDWRAGELVVTGKGHRIERLPLPVDVGEAVAEYLCDGRPAHLALGSHGVRAVSRPAPGPLRVGVRPHAHGPQDSRASRAGLPQSTAVTAHRGHGDGAGGSRAPRSRRCRVTAAC